MQASLCTISEQLMILTLCVGRFSANRLYASASLVGAMGPALANTGSQRHIQIEECSVMAWPQQRGDRLCA